MEKGEEVKREFWVFGGGTHKGGGIFKGGTKLG